jgi:guanylate kinase
LRQRLEARQTDTPEAIQKRLAMTAGEMAYARRGDHDVIIKNDDLDRAYGVFKSALQGTLQGHGDELPEEEDEEKKLRLSAAA